MTVEPLRSDAIKDLTALMPRCKDCAHWEEKLPFGTCYRILGVDDWCNPQEPGAVAYIGPDDQFVGAPLRTRSTFGCVLWEAKP